VRVFNMVAKGEGRGEGCCCTEPERQPIKDFSKLITHGLLPGAEPEDEKKCFGSYVRCCTDLPVRARHSGTSTQK